MKYVMTYMMSELGLGEGFLWLVLPAAVQWLVLRKTQDRWQCLRLAVLAPAVWVLCMLFGSLLLLLLGAILLLLFLSAILQTNLLSLMFWLLKELLTSEPILNTLTRVGLLLAGWGSAWALLFLERKSRQKEL